ncbi:MAG: hypothetical protein LC121_23605, partial [Anaerolineae bacterium]|nr:hypothetical protein [Anaerolineae bacterium]
VLLTGVSTLALALIANERIQFLINSRYLIVLFVPLALIVGIGAARTKLAPLMMAIWVAAGVWISLNPGYFVNAWVTVLPWDTLADDLRERAQPGDPLVYLLPDGTPGWMHE